MWKLENVFQQIKEKSNPEFIYYTTGYYRVNYDRTNWKLISNYLNSEEYKNIHILNRAQIIDDAYHLLMANQLELKIFLDLTEYLSQETDYIAWYPMIKALEYLSGFLPYKESQPLKVDNRFSQECNKYSFTR